MKVSLTQKIYAGNFLLLAAIVGMVVILFRERSRMREIDFEVHDLQSVRNDIHAAHLHITELSLLGESLISQENADTANYRQAVHRQPAAGLEAPVQAACTSRTDRHAPAPACRQGNALVPCRGSHRDTGCC